MMRQFLIVLVSEKADFRFEISSCARSNAEKATLSAYSLSLTLIGCNKNELFPFVEVVYDANANLAEEGLISHTN